MGRGRTLHATAGAADDDAHTRAQTHSGENWPPRPIAFTLLGKGQVTMGGGRGSNWERLPYPSPLSQLSGYPNLLILWGKFLKSPQFPNETTTGRGGDYFNIFRPNRLQVTPAAQNSNLWEADTK